MVADGSRRHRVVIVKRQCEVGFGEAREQAIGQHRPCAAETFFRWLSHHEQRAVPAVAMFCHEPRGSGPRGHVKIVAARVHHRRRLSGRVLRDDGAGEGKPGLLFDRERVELRAQHHRGSGAVLEHGHDPGLADARGDVEAERLQARREFGRRLDFLKPEFRRAMKVDVERVDVGKDGIDFGGSRSRPARGPDCAESVQVVTNAIKTSRDDRST